MRRFFRHTNPFIRLSVCLALIGILAYDPSHLHVSMTYALQPEGHSNSPESQPPDPEKLKQELKKLAAQMEKMFDALEEAAKEIPRDTFDPQAIVTKVGKKPEKLFEWVRDKTFLVPYRGALRDSVGVLMDRRGNSLDRALLLSALLQESGQKKIQLAYAELSATQAEKLLDQARPIPKQGVFKKAAPSMQELNQQIEKYAQKYGLKPKEIQKALAKMNLQSQKLAEEAVQRTFEQTQQITKMLQEKIDIPDRDQQMKKLRADAIKALQQHWWVQYHDGQKMVDIDPSLPEAQPGQTLAKAQKIVPASKLGDQLQDEAHMLTLRVVIERWEKGKLVELPVLEQELYPAAWVGERIAIHHAPLNWPKDLNLFEEKKPLESLKSAVLAQNEWIPTLSVGKHRLAKFSFTDTGEVRNPKLPGFVQNVLAGKKLVQGVEEAAEGLGATIGKSLTTGKIQRPPSNQPQGNAQLTAEWIEYEIHVPGEKAKTIRRQIFDLTGPAARAQAQGKDNVPAPKITEANRLERGLTLLGGTEILAVVCQLSPEFVAHQVTQNILAHRHILPELLRDAASDKPRDLMGQASKLTPTPNQLFTLTLARQQWNRFRNLSYLERPNIFGYHTFTQYQTDNQLSLCRTFDIVLNEVAVTPHTSENPFLVRLEQGVLDTNAEALILDSCGKVENSAEMFRAAGKTDLEWRVIQVQKDLDADSVKIPANAQALIRTDLKSGSIVIAPEKMVALNGQQSFGWWRINPETGTILGIGEKGWGQTTTEYLLNTAIVVTGLVFCVASCLLAQSRANSYVCGALCAHGAIFGFLGIGLLFLGAGGALVLQSALFSTVAFGTGGLVGSGAFGEIAPPSP